MQDRRLFTVRNIGDKRTTRKSALMAPRIKLKINKPQGAVLENYILMEDPQKPGYQNTKSIAEEIQPDLLTILSGESLRWKLWKVVVYTGYLSLHYIDTEATDTRTVTSMVLHLSWAPVTNIEFYVPPQVRVPLNNFKINCQQADEQHRILNITYIDVGSGLKFEDNYACEPLVVR